MKVVYVGKSEYCYSNSACMLLYSIGEPVTPAEIEVPAGIGLGAFISRENNFLFVSPLAIAPDAGLSHSLVTLGFDFEEGQFDQENLPIAELKELLKPGPILLGPLDMGYLVYQPHHNPPYGADHFVLAYGIDSEKVYLHDPYGFPNVFLTFEQLKPAWKADNIKYKKGSYHYWRLPNRTSRPNKKEIYTKTLEFFKFIYKESGRTANTDGRTIDEAAIYLIGNKLTNGGLKDFEINHLTYFALLLATRRAEDYSTFFEEFNPNLADLKSRQAKLFGHSHVYLVAKDYENSAKTLNQAGEVEKEIKEILLNN